MLDFKIVNGRVLDGTGAPAFRADVGICGEKVSEIGDLSRAEAADSFDAAGCYVTPGFVDVHSHSDAYLLIEPGAHSKTYQGITTEIVGNCGASAGPRCGEARMPGDWQDKTYPGRWNTVAEYRALLEQVRPAPNVALLIGHNTLRASVAGYADRAVTADELDGMKAMLDRALADGGCGLSTGLVYAPGMFSAQEEIIELAKVAAARNGIYTSHMRSEGAKLWEAIDEAIAIGRASGARVQISHLKTSGAGNWGKLDGAFERIERAQSEGVEIASDRYPYTASCTDLDVMLPDWAAAGTKPEILGRLRDPAMRAKVRADVLRGRDDAYWSRVMIGSTRHPDFASCMGRKLVDVAAEWGQEPVDAALGLMDRDELNTGAIFFGMNEDNLWRILAKPWVMIGSDGSLRAPTGPLSHDHPHPRNYATFPRFLRASLDGRTVPVEEAVRKMTSLPANHFRLAQRGRLGKGYYADIAVWRPETIRDRADYARPHQLSEGVELLVVNGTITLRNGKLTGRRSGRLLA